METTEGYDPAVWSQMANELGLQSLHIPEEYGGQGFTFVELGIVLEEMGRVLLCAPYFSTVVLAADAIMNAGTDDQKGKLLPGIASGETIAALAFTEPNGKWDAAGIEMEAKGSGDSYTLDGTKMFVIDGHTANLIVVAARADGTSGEDGISFFTVDGDAAGLTRTPLATMDQTRKQAQLEFSRRRRHAARRAGRGLAGAVEDARPGRGRRRPTRWSAARRRCSRCRSSTPRCACSSVGRSARSRRSSTSAPTCCSRSSRASRPRTTRRGPPPRTTTSCRSSASLAKAYCSDAYFHAAAENIQIHGGIGFTWEHDAHLYFKRAKSSEILLGDATYHRELLAQRIGI